ncbi:MAG: ferrous iron transport protein A [Firmicutes bacterium]|nr:ferrous iron transport protein A [Bacillota bacterium]
MNQIPLTLLSPGTTAKIAGINSRQSGLVHKLAALGVLPGLPISVIQTYPSYLVQINQTQLALDQATARCIVVLV